MATIYVPSSTGWQESHGNGFYLRFRVDQTYNSSTNTSSLSIKLQYKGSQGFKNISNSGSYARIDSTDLFSPLPGKGFYVNYSNTWTDLCDSNYDIVPAATYTVQHASDGSATVPMSLLVGISTYSWENSANLILNGTPTYTVSYAANGGSSTPESQTKTYGVALTLRGSISRASTSAGTYTVTLNANGGSVSPGYRYATRTTAYTFSKWRSTGGADYNAGGSYTANESTVMTAQWNSSTTTAAVTLPTPTRTGYTFKFWGTSTSATSGYTGSYTPTGDVTLYAIWQVKSYTLSISAGAGTTVTVKRGLQTLSNGNTIYHGDTLTISATSSTGYNAPVIKVNGNTHTSGASYTVTGDVSVVATATVISYTLSLTTNNGVVANVLRTSSPIGSAPNGLLSDGATLYYNDTISVTYSVNSGYTLDEATVNGSAVSSSPYTVQSNMTVVITAVVGAMAYIGNVAYQAYIGNGTNWEQYQAYIGNGSSWVAY